MKEYPKIYAPYMRHTEGPRRNRLIEGEWSTPELEYLQHTRWDFTEKVDGTNIRVGWDGHKTGYAGRSDKAQVPAKLVTVLDELFPEELFEQVFKDTAATLYGEGFGGGIQKGGCYRPDMSFVLFDVAIDGRWLRRPSVEDIASRLGVQVVPRVLTGTLHDGIDAVRTGLTSAWGEFAPEGLVGVPAAGLLDRDGQRITVKIKAKDFPADSDG